MTVTTITLTDFLLARIAEDEAVARVAMDASPNVARVLAGPSDGAWEQQPSEALAVHYRRYNYARVLAECEAKRRIVADHRIRPDVEEVDLCDSCADWYGQSVQPFAWPCPTLRALALPYADHPDYREEWTL